MNSQDLLSIIAVVLVAMALATAGESAAPLRSVATGRGPHRRANLAMTGLVLSFAFGLTSAVTIAATYVTAVAPGLMLAAGLPAAVQFGAGIVALDFAYGYAAHRTMHASPTLWKFHRVHHSDEFVDVTTSLRTHPVEVAWRHAWLFATVWVLGVPPAAVVVFRLLSAVNGVLEHANIRVAPALDTMIARLWVTPNMHKVHHSRDRHETDANYGNLFPWYDRLLGTFVPTERALVVEYGLDSVHPSELGSFGALLTMPWRQPKPLSAHQAVTA